MGISKLEEVMEKNRIADLNKYIEKNYPKAIFMESSEIELPNFLQRDFQGADNNCTLREL